MSTLVNLGWSVSDTNAMLTVAIVFLSRNRPAVTWKPTEALLHDVLIDHLAVVPGGWPSLSPWAVVGLHEVVSIRSLDLRDCPLSTPF